MLCIQHTTCTRRIANCRLSATATFPHIMSTVACLLQPHFPTLCHKRHDFRKKKIVTTQNVFWFSLLILSDTFLVLRTIPRNVIKMCTGLLRVKCQTFLWDFSETWIFSTDLRQIIKYQTSLQPIQWQSSCSWERTNGQTDWQTDGRTDRQIDRQRDRRTDGLTNRQTL